MKKETRYALISIYDKTNIVELAKALSKEGLSIISSGGTASYLVKNKIPVIPIEKITNSPESFDGRMKTISFQIASGILYDRTNTKHVQEATILNVPSIDFVVCNVYPFWENPSIEMIDVGGPTMIRAAAKNYKSVTVVTNPKAYDEIVQQLKKTHTIPKEFRYRLAAEAFAYMARYDILISNYFQQNDKKDTFLHLGEGKQLRYGDNPHQKGYLFKEKNADSLSVDAFTVLQGKDPSFSNYLDVNAGIETLALIGKRNPACVILKHNNPCGAAVGETIADAFKKSWYQGDTLAAFGGIILVNRPVSKSLAKEFLADKKFMEIIAASGFSKSALSLLSTRSKLQLWQNRALSHPQPHAYQDIKKVRGGYLTQEGNTHTLTKNALQIVTKKRPTPQQVDDLLFAWSICQVSKSNCVVVAKDKTLLSSGVGQQDRKRCCELCISKANGPLKGAVGASDGFFPFADGPHLLIEAGIAAIIQPGGSIRDQEVIDLCDKLGIAMAFTGIRAFKH